MQLRTLVFAIAAIVSAQTGSACDSDPARGKPVAKVSEPVETTSSSLGSSTAAKKYVFSSAGSKIEFVGAKVTRKHEGAFHVFSGAVELVEGDLAKSLINAEIATGSLTADDPKLASHLKSPDFLDVERFPKARFTSTALVAGGEGGATHTVTGNLELHGVTKSITFPVRANTANGSLQADAEFAIDRQTFGITFPGMPDDLIKDQVLLRLTIRGTNMPR